MRDVLLYLGEQPVRNLIKPRLPTNNLAQQVQKVLYKLGIAEFFSTAIQPRRGNVGDSRFYFDAEDQAFFEREAQSAIRLLGTQFMDVSSALPAVGKYSAYHDFLSHN